MRKRFIQPRCLELDCKEFTIINHPNEFWSKAINLLTDEELEAHERKIWEAARDRLYQEGDFEWTFENYDDYKKSLKDEEKRDGKDA